VKARFFACKNLLGLRWAFVATWLGMFFPNALGLMGYLFYPY